MTNPILQFPENQPKNGLYGKIPMELLPKLRELSNHEVRVFVVLSIFANFKRKPLGAVDIGVKQIARECGTSPGSIRRALPKIEGIGLISLGGSPGSPRGITVIHYGVQGDPPGGSPRSQKSAGAPKESTTSTAPRRSEEVSEEEVKKKRGKRAKKPAPPHPLNGLVSWDKEKREVRFGTDGVKRLNEKLACLNLGTLTVGELQEGWGRLNGHLMGNPFKTNPKTLPAIVLNWFQTDLRRKNNNPRRGKPLAQRIEEKTIERMKDDGINHSGTEVDGFSQLLLESGHQRRNRRGLGRDSDGGLGRGPSERLPRGTEELEDDVPPAPRRNTR